MYLARENQWVREKETWDGIGIELLWNHTWYAVCYTNDGRLVCHLFTIIVIGEHFRIKFSRVCAEVFSPTAAGCALISKSKKMLLLLLQFQLHFFIVDVVIIIIIFFVFSCIFALLSVVLE